MKRIKDTGKSARKVSPEELAKALGAKIDVPYKGFDPEVMAWQIIDFREFDTLVDFLIELKAYREMTCDHCGLKLTDHKDKRIAARSCDG